jgi:meso-butanediol dehydrogenase / (S,S)-butanediol dehydrogenase / diacetyl reductase
MEQDFLSKAVLVTGAARGLGRDTAELFLARGASVLLVDIDEPRLVETIGQIGDCGGRAKHFVCDTSRRDQCYAAVQAAVDAFGRLDVLANVAGVLGINHFKDVTEAEVERILKVNVAGPLFLSQAAIPHLIESHGNIVNVASAGGTQGSAYIVPYTASKAALIQLTRSLAMEFMKSPIRINTVSPGPMPTEISTGLNWREDFDSDLTTRYMGMRSKERASPGVAEAIVFVASDKAHIIHGANINADNGATAG